MRVQGRRLQDWSIRPRPDAPSAAGGQAGFGLPEVLVTIAVAGVVVLGLAAGLLTLVRTAGSNEQRQQIQLALGNFSEGVRALDYLDCTGPGGATVARYDQDYDARAASWQPPTSGPLQGMTARMVDLRFWDPVGRRFVDACAGTDHGAQELTLEVSWKGRTDRAQIVLGDR